MFHDGSRIDCPPIAGAATTSQQHWPWFLLAGAVVALAGLSVCVYRLNARLLRANHGEREAAEAARKAALAEAVHLARQRSQFLSQMSHELRTPLNGIMGFAQILERDPSLNERQHKAVRNIHESGQNLLNLINDILDLVRIDAGRLELSANDTHLAAFLQLVCDSIRAKAEEKGLVFVLDAGPGLPAAVHLDEKRLRQVLLNLLSNAVNFSDSGRVTLRVAGGDSPPTAGAARLRFEVADQGAGMSEAQLEGLFRPFEELDATRRGGGSSLGLAISRQLVRLMHGEIEARSGADGGSVFSFEIEVPLPGRTSGR